MIGKEDCGEKCQRLPVFIKERDSVRELK